MNDQEFLKHLEKNIPITKHFGIQSLQRQSQSQDQEISIQVSLAAHLNHKKTAFGGSLYSLSALTCYGWLWTALPKLGLFTDDIVIQKGEIEYLKPVNADFTVKTSQPQNWDSFTTALKSKSKGRIDLTAEIFVNQQSCAKFSGTYVAVTPSTSSTSRPLSS